MLKQKNDNILDTVRLVRSWRGAGIVVGLYGEQNNIQQACNLIYNYGGTDGEPTYLSDNFAFIWINKPNFIKVLQKNGRQYEDIPVETFLDDLNRKIDYREPSWA